MWNKHVLLLAACVTMALCGCSAFHPEPLSAAENAHRLDGRSLRDPRLQQFIAAMLARDDRPVGTQRWHLATLTLAALYYHPDIKIAQARLAGAEAAVLTAREQPNPTMHLANVISAAAVAGAIPPAAVPITVGPVIDFILETAGKRAARTAQAQRLAEAARWDLATAEWQVRGAVRDALLDMWAADRRLALARQRLALQRQLAQLLEHRLAAGAAAAPEVAREQSRYAEHVLAVSELDRIAADGRVRLASAIGISVSALDGATLRLDPFDHPPAVAPVAGWREAALTGRSDVQASLADYEAAQDALRLAVAGQYPDLTFGAGYNYDLGVNRYILDVSATLPVLHQQQGRIAEAIAKRREAAAMFNQVQARAIAAIDRAETDLRLSTQAVDAGNAVLAEARRQARQVEAAFRDGQADRPALVSAQLAVVTTELARFDAVVRQRQAIGGLEDALQHPLYDPSPIAMSLSAAELAK